MQPRGERAVQRELVRCLACRYLYEKPMRGGTSRRNPGCPQCGYVGWMEAPLRLVSAAGPALATRLTPPK
jgi:hypothetical protein